MIVAFLVCLRISCHKTKTEGIKLQKLQLLHTLPRVCGWLAYQLLVLLNLIPQGNKDTTLIFTMSKVLRASKDLTLTLGILDNVDYKFYIVTPIISNQNISAWRWVREKQRMDGALLLVQSS